MTESLSDLLLTTLQNWGVEVVFGIPGDGNNGVMEALRKKRDQIRFIQTRHEESAAFMACAYAKYTGKLGVCLATSGPGAVHLLNGLYDAKYDGQPVLAITGSTFHDLMDTYSQQDVPLDRLFEDVAAYNVRVMGPAHLPTVANIACRTALSYRTVAHITIPVDFQAMEVSRDVLSMHNPGLCHTSSVFAAPAGVPSEKDVMRAAETLNAGEKIAILAGRGALGASIELEQVAERLGAPVVKALLGKAALPDSSPYTTGTAGFVGTQPSNDALKECDTLFMIGTSFPYMEFLPPPGRARGVQIDIDPVRIGLRYPVEVGLAGDVQRTLQLLLPLLAKNRKREFLHKTQSKMSAWWNVMKERGTSAGTPMAPQVVGWELGKRLSGNAIVSGDSGLNATFFAQQLPVKNGQMYSLSGNLASMASGLSYAIAAQIAYPDRQCVALVGDGGFTMLLGEFMTAVKYRLPVKVIVLKNNYLAQIKWEQMMFLGNPEYGCELQPMDFAAFAKACGAQGFRVENPVDCGSAIDQALDTGGPVIVEAVVDPMEPFMPPRLSRDQASKIKQALKKGEPDGKIIMNIINEREKEITT